MKPNSKFLVVDDDVAFRTRLVKALASRGYLARDAGTVDEAIETAAAFKPDAAVVDLKMPGGKSGLDLVPSLVARHPGVQVVVLTGYGSIATAVVAVRNGAVNYLSKPADADQILAALGIGSAAEPSTSSPGPIETPSLERVEWEHIQRVLSDCGGNISRAATVLGLHRRTLQRKLATRPPSR